MASTTSTSSRSRNFAVVRERFGFGKEAVSPFLGFAQRAIDDGNDIEAAGLIGPKVKFAHAAGPDQRDSRAIRFRQRWSIVNLGRIDFPGLLGWDETVFAIVAQSSGLLTLLT